MQSAFGGFNQLFGVEAPGLRSMRGLGMQLFNQFGPAKRLATRIALGTAGDLPELARPIG
jgi:2-octaprenylphenol hydroxylase